MKNIIIDLRRLYDVSQFELANVVGVSRQTISNIERCVYIPSLPVAYKIAKAFELTIEEVFLLKGVNYGKKETTKTVTK